MMATEEVQRRRTVEVRVKLSPAMAEEFGSIAADRGALPATLAAIAIGEYVEKVRQNRKLTQMVALDASKRIADAFTPERMVELQKALLSDPEVVAVMAQHVNG